MTTYRVGSQGATVFDADGAPVLWLRPGQVVVEGSTELSGTPAAQHHDLYQQQKRVRDYADKRVRPAEDKATPPRQPDPRLRNPLAGSG